MPSIHMVRGGARTASKHKDLKKRSAAQPLTVHSSWDNIPFEEVEAFLFDIFDDSSLQHDEFLRNDVRKNSKKSFQKMYDDARGADGQHHWRHGKPTNATSQKKTAAKQRAAAATAKQRAATATAKQRAATATAKQRAATVAAKQRAATVAAKQRAAAVAAKQRAAANKRPAARTATDLRAMSPAAQSAEQEKDLAKRAEAKCARDRRKETIRQKKLDGRISPQNTGCLYPNKSDVAKDKKRSRGKFLIPNNTNVTWKGQAGTFYIKSYDREKDVYNLRRTDLPNTTIVGAAAPSDVKKC